MQEYSNAFHKYKMKIISIYLCLWLASIEKLIAQECSNSTTNNWIAISTDCSKEKCPVPVLDRPSFDESKGLRGRSSKYYSKLCTNQLNSHQTKEVVFQHAGVNFSIRGQKSPEEKRSFKRQKKHIDFKTNCGRFSGKACKSRTTIVDYQQCYPGGRNFEYGLGMACLSRSEVDRNPFQKKKELSRGRKNLREQVTEVTEKYLICHGIGQNYTLDEVCKLDESNIKKQCNLKDGTVLELNMAQEGNHQLCQDFSFWSDITKSFNNSCISDENGDYPVVRKCITHKMPANKEMINKYCGFSWNCLIRRIEACPNSKTKSECNKTDDFYCSKSMSCIRKSDICDGIVHCYHGEDEDLETCAHIYPQTATIKCLEINRGNIDITIKATPCNGITKRECKDIDDEDCGQKGIVLIITLIVVLVGIISLSLYMHISTTINYPTIIHKGQPLEAINDRRMSTLYPMSTTIEFWSNSKGNVLAHIKNSNDLLTCAKILSTPFGGFVDVVLKFLDRPVVKFIQLPFQIFVKYLDLIKDIILLHHVVVSMTAGAGLLTIFEYWNTFPSVVIFILMASLIVPYALGGMRLATRDLDIHIIFWPAQGRIRRIMLSILTFILSPFHTLILYLRKYHIELKLRANPDSRILLLEWEVMHHHLCQHIKLELGLETIFQLTLQIILLLYAITLTRTTEGLNQIFNEATELSGDLAKDYKVIFLYLSITWSVMSNVNSHIKGLSAHRQHFPLFSKGIAIVYAFFGITTRVLAIIAFFTPCLGLFSIQRHWNGEQINWHPALIENFVINKSVIFEGSSPMSVDSIFIRPRENNSLAFNASLMGTNGVVSKNFQIDGTIQFGNSSQIAWHHLDRWTYSLDDSPKPPSYSLYTMVSLQYYFIIWLFILLTQICVIFVVKFNLAKAFGRLNILEKIIHCVEGTNLPYNAQEWDTPRNGNAHVHISRMKANQLEGLVLIFINLVFKMTMLVPLYVLAFRMKERHVLLFNSISFFKEEHDAMKTVTILIVGFTSYVVIGTLFEAIFFSLYNSSYHPFANILDLSDEVFVRQRLISDQQISSDLPVAIQLSEVSSSTTDNIERGIESCQKRTDANVSKDELSTLDKMMKKYNSYLPSILSFVFISVFVISMWHVKNDLENGYCDYDNGECCAHWLIGDGTCDQRNNFQLCGNYDGGDCRPPNITEWPDCPHNPELIQNGICDDHLKFMEGCNYDGGDCCDQSLIGSKHCDVFNNFPTCENYDGGDCRLANITRWLECPHNPIFIGDGKCEQHLKNKNCNYDGGDCCKKSNIGSGKCSGQNNFASCYNFDGGDCFSDGHCNISLIGDGKCDQINIHANCSFDGGDCCTEPLIGNGKCDDINNFLTCENYDGGDCRPPNITEWQDCLHNPGLIGDGKCNEHLKFKAECNHDGGDCCDQLLIGDRKCDGSNNFESCAGNDGGDCRSLNNTNFPDCRQNPSLIGDGVCDYANHNEECNFDGEDCSQCLTNGGASLNSKCVFPFIYQGKTFTSCTRFDDPDHKPWCSTLVDENGRHVCLQGKWGYCGNDCPIPAG